MRKNVKKLDLVQKIDKFNSICNERGVNLNDSYLARIYHENSMIRFICEEPIKLCNYNTGEDYISYASCNAGEINDKNFIKKFKKLDLNCKENVYSFIDSIESSLDWNEVTKKLSVSKKALEDNNYSAYTYNQILDDVLGAMQNNMTLDEYHEYEEGNQEFEETNQIIINVNQVWESVHDDYRASIEIGEGGIVKGTVIASYDEETIRNFVGNIDRPLSEKELENAFSCLVNLNFDSYLELPKISNCSKLLQQIYDNVRESDATMCHISDEDWDGYYSGNYSDNDVEILKEEIKEYGLSKVIVLDDGNYKIIGYGDLETRFIDDRNLELNNECEFIM